MLKLQKAPHKSPPAAKHLLFDLHTDPRQQQPLDDPAVEARLCRQMSELFTVCDAPADQYERMGLERV